MEFYKIQNPTTKQIFDAIIANDYTPLESIKPKAKQIKVLLLNHFDAKEILVTFDNVTNSGGVPIFLSEKCDLQEVASENNDDWNDLSEEEQNDEIKLLSCCLRKFDDIFFS